MLFLTRKLLQEMLVLKMVSFGFYIIANGLGYEQLRGLAINFASTHQVGNFAGISKVVENKQLLIAIVVQRFYSNIFSNILSIPSASNVFILIFLICIALILPNSYSS